MDYVGGWEGVNTDPDEVRTLSTCSLVLWPQVGYLWIYKASKVPLKHMFNSHANCSAEWCFKTRASEEGKTYNERDDGF